MKRFEEFRELTGFLYADAKIRKDLLANPKMKIESEEEWLAALRFILPILEKADFTSLDALKSSMLPAIAEAGKKNGQILWPMRIALSGEEYSPWAFELAYILWKEETLQRIHNLI